MTNEEAIFIINNRLNTYYCTDEDIEALNKAVKALMKEYSFEHVIIKHPKYGDCDGWIDRRRMLLFVDPITCEFAISCGVSWEADNE